MQTQLIVAADPAPAIPPPNGNFLDWGIAVAILVFLGREALQFFKKKDEEDSKMTEVLFNDQRDTNRDLRAFLEKQQQHYSKQQSEWTKLTEYLSLMEQRLARHSTEIVVDNRDKITNVEKKVDALHRRLDEMDLGGGEN